MRAAVHPTEDVCGLDVRWKRRLCVVFVHHGNVVKLVDLLFHHAAHAMVQDYGELVGESGVVGAAIGNRGGDDVTAAILMLQTFPAQSRTAGGGTEKEPASTLVGRSPDQIADALEAEYRVVDIERQHGHAVHAVGRACGGPGRKGAGFCDALLEELS